MPRGYQKRTRGLFDPNSKEPFRISRSKIDLFIDCPRCFYLDQRLGVKRTDFPAFTLNNAVDELLKREFDIHRAKGEPHPLMRQYKIDATPLNDLRMEEWRDALRRGVQYHHAKTNLIVRGGVDDIWVTQGGEFIVVDYKATSKKDEVSLDGYWQQAYKRQVEVYQWILRGMGERVSNVAYFVYVNGNSDAASFDGKLEFSVTVLPHKGDTSWIEPTIIEIAQVLRGDAVPEPKETCEYCGYREAAGRELQARVGPKSKARKSSPTLGI
ncbi:MAG TPA: PD-(D/E)XK nuclease family protein [Candidatus Paceibacterota bacterium]